MEMRTNSFDPENRPAISEIDRFRARHREANCSDEGYSLLEMLVVLTILALLVGLVAPRVMGYLEGAKSKTAKAQIEQISTALELYYLDAGGYPSSVQGLKALVVRPGDLSSWNGPYLTKLIVPDDPWGRPYQYKSPGDHGKFDLFSFGADGAEGGDGDGADVTSWN